MKKRTIFGLVFLLLLTSTLMLVFDIKQAKSSEPPFLEWDRAYGGTNYDGAHSVVQTLDGGYVVVGVTKSFGAGGYDFWLVKTDCYGNMEWNKTYGGVSNDHAASVMQTGDGGYVITGHTYSFGVGSADFWLIKTDELGNMQWNQTYGGTSYDVAWSLMQTSDGGFVLAGQTYSFGSGWSNAWLVKTDEFGNMEWNQTYGRKNYDYVISFVQTSDGGYALAGRVASQQGFGDGDFWLVKTDSSGNVQWDKTYGGTGEETAHSVVQAIDGGFALTGLTNSLGAGGFDTWLVKTDSNGEMEWNQTYGGANDDWAHSVVQTGDEGYALAGYSVSFGVGAADFWSVNTDKFGNMEWNETYGGSNEDMAYSLAQTTDGGYVLAGFTESFGAGTRDFWLIKLAPLKISATIDVDPNTLNLKSKGEWVTAYIELPEGYDVADINVSSLMLNDTVLVDPDAPTLIGDYDEDGVPDLMVKFDRSEVAAYVLANVNLTKLYEERFMTITLTVTGYLNDDTMFQGSNTIKVIFIHRWLMAKLVRYEMYMQRFWS